MAAITAKLIESLRPGHARKEIPDGLVRGLYLIVQPSGKLSWCVRYRASGRPRKLTLGAYPTISLKAARELAGKALIEVAGGVDPAKEKKAARAAVPDRDLIETVSAKFLTQHVKRNLRPRSVVEVERILNKRIVPAWRGRRLADIRRADVHDLLDGIIAAGTPVAANAALAWFRRLCSWAIERGIIEVSPAAGIRAPATETARDRVLTDVELAAVWRAAEALGRPHGSFVQMLILTGQRRNEVAGLTWGEIDLDAKLWTLPAARAKNGVEHTVPLSDRAIAILEAIPKIAGGYVFTVSGRAPIRNYDDVKRRLDVSMPADTPHWTLHDIRRSVASGCARLGVAIHVVEKLLNHTSGTFAGVVKVYQRYTFADEKRAAMAIWARHVETVLTGKLAVNIVEIATRR